MPTRSQLAPSALLRAALWVIVPAAALGWQQRLRGSLDRSDYPGPGGVKVLTALATGDLDRDGLTALCARLLGVLDPVAAVDVVVAAGGVFAVLGAMLAAGALGGRAAAGVAGVAAATFAQGAFAAVCYGPDGPATGLVWLGVGLCWWGARHGGGWLAGVPTGVALAAAGVAVKVNAAPAVALLALTPLLVPPRHAVRLVAVCALLGVGALVGLELLPSRPTQQASAPTTVTLPILLSGLDAAWSLPARQHPHATPLNQLGALALAAGLLPGRRWLLRGCVAAVGLVAVGVAAATVGDLLRPRYLLAATLPAFVLIGALAADLGAIWRRPILRTGPPLAAAIALGTLLTFDTVAYLSAWSDLRVAAMGARPHTLPPAPAAWQRRYARLSELVLTDTSEVGARSLVILAENAPQGGIVTVPLRDAREFHLSAGASLTGADYRILEARACCEGQPVETCAPALVQAVDAAGARLVLPTEMERRMRVPRPHQALWRALRASGEFTQIDPWWVVREPTGAGGPLPCPPPTVAPAPGRPPRR